MTQDLDLVFRCFVDEMLVEKTEFLVLTVSCCTGRGNVDVNVVFIGGIGKNGCAVCSGEASVV
jgi:hypothetical protein